MGCYFVQTSRVVCELLLCASQWSGLGMVSFVQVRLEVRYWLRSHLSFFYHSKR